MRERIDTERLRLRRAGEDDLETYARRIYGDAEVMRTLPGGRPLALADALSRARANLIGHWGTHGFGPWLVETGAPARVVGHAGLRWWPESEDVEVLYALEPGAWGLGYATEAARASLEAGFADLGLSRIIAGALDENGASIAVIRKLGMREFEVRDLAGMRVRMFETVSDA